VVPRIAALPVLLVLSMPVASAQPRVPLSESHLRDIATLLRLEDTRRFEVDTLERLLESAHPEVRRRAAMTIGRLANPAGRPVLEAARADANVDVAASVVFATGQIAHVDDVPWLSSVLHDDLVSPIVAREAARALGKIRSPDAHLALAAYLEEAQDRGAAAHVIGEALLSIGRFANVEDVEPIVLWSASNNVELRWRATWALFRLRRAETRPHPETLPHLVKLAGDGSGEVRFWAVRGLTRALVDEAGRDRAEITEVLADAVLDRDRRVRAEALRALLQYDDDTAFQALMTAIESPDPWLSVSAAEAAGRFATRADALVPALVEATSPDRTLWLRVAALPALVSLSPALAVGAAAALVRTDSAVARAAGVQALGRLGAAGRSKLDELNADPELARLLPATSGGRRGGVGWGGGGGGGGGG
jgi:hypothetical protein